MSLTQFLKRRFANRDREAFFGDETSDVIGFREGYYAALRDVVAELNKEAAEALAGIIPVLRDKCLLCGCSLHPPTPQAP